MFQAKPGSDRGTSRDLFYFLLIFLVLSEFSDIRVIFYNQRKSHAHLERTVTFPVLLWEGAGRPRFVAQLRSCAPCGAEFTPPVTAIYCAAMAPKWPLCSGGSRTWLRHPRTLPGTWTSSSDPPPWADAPVTPIRDTGHTEKITLLYEGLGS